MLRNLFFSEKAGESPAFFFIFEDMKKLLVIGVMCGFVFAGRAQCSVMLPGTTVKVTQDSTIATNIGAGQNYLICSGVTLTYSGTQSATVNYYLESNAKVKSQRSHTAVVWMKTGAEFDASYSESGNWAITQESYYESGSTFTDHIAGANFNECSQVVYSYGSVGSCSGGTTSIPSVAINQAVVKVFPNPANDKVSIDFGVNGLKQVELMSVLGVKVGNYSTQKEALVIDVSRLHAGPYFIVITDESGNRLTRKVIVKH